MSDDLREQLAASLRAQYTLEQEIGAGGFARVFLAQEQALGRRVVVKILSPELAAGLSAQRFQREIRLAASLQQANIVPLLAAGESDGLPFYTMPFVEGLSLRQRLERDGRPTLDRCVAILRDVARALAFAHEQGVVHRDIKPENILLSGEAAVVTDFGIAKAIHSARAGADAGSRTTLTQPGLALGTPAYMAPEQIAGDPGVDHRADLYAFGCVAYELLAGQAPFTGNSQSLLSAHLASQATPIGSRCPECPPALSQLVMRCLAKDPAERPTSAHELLRVLDGTVAPATSWERWRQRLTPAQRRGAALGAAFAAAGLALLLWRVAQPPATARDVSAIAVLPFVNLSGDSAGEYVADGIADELANSLGRLPSLRVVARGMSYRFRGRRAIDADEVRRVLAADAFVHGSVSRGPGGLRVSAQLTTTRDRSELWASSYLRSTGDALAFQDSITRAIAAALGERLRGSTEALQPAPTTRMATADPEAFDLYLRGRFLLQRRGAGVRRSIENFERAIARDSSFARAHAALALALQLLPYFESVDAAQVRDRAVAAANAALTRDSTLAEAHTALGMVHQHSYRWAQADSAYRRAVAIDSTEADAHIQYGRFLFYTGRFGAAQDAFERARALDPYSAVASAWVGHLMVLSGQLEAGYAELRRALEIDSAAPPLLTFAAQASRLLGRPERAREYAERLWRSFPQWRRVAAGELATLGDSLRAQQIRDSLAASAHPTKYSSLVMLHLSLGDTASALTALERATDAGEIWPTYYSASEPVFDGVRRSARFAAVLRRAGLDVRVFTSPSGGRPR